MEQKKGIRTPSVEILSKLAQNGKPYSQSIEKDYVMQNQNKLKVYLWHRINLEQVPHHFQQTIRAELPLLPPRPTEMQSPAFVLALPMQVYGW
jgi:hypothetical protein